MEQSPVKASSDPQNTQRDLQLVIFDLQTSDLPSLERLYGQVLEKGGNAGRWYRTHKHGKRTWAVRLRLLSIILGGLATLTPTVVMLFNPFFTSTPTDPGRERWAQSLPLLASIFAVTAATLVLLDRFFGYSSAWIRYETTFQEIEAKTETFQLAWARMRAKLQGLQPLPDSAVGEALDLFVTYLQSIHEAVKLETQTWVAEFKTSLADLEKAVESQRAAAIAAVAAIPARGAIRIVIEGADQLDNRSWDLQLDDRAPVKYEGTSTAALSGVEPGLARVRVLGSRQGTKMSSEHIVKVLAGEVTELTVRLG